LFVSIDRSEQPVGSQNKQSYKRRINLPVAATASDSKAIPKSVPAEFRIRRLSKLSRDLVHNSFGGDRPPTDVTADNKSRVNEKSPGVFLDRGGVSNEEVGYIYRSEQLKLIPSAALAVKRLNERGLVVVVVSNQSAIGRGVCPDGEIQRVNASLSKQLLFEGARISRFYYCPHHPTECKGEYRRICEFRKPRPGMLRQAASESNLDLENGFIVGDYMSDIEAGLNAGCKTVLIESREHSELYERQNGHECIASSLVDTVNSIFKG